MTVAIEDGYIESEVDKRLVLAPGAFGAKMSIGTDWNTIHIAARVAFSGSGGLSGTPKFFIGVMNTPTAGMANCPALSDGDANTHAWYLRTNSSTWIDSANEYIWTANSGFAWCKNEAGSETTMSTNLFGTSDYVSKQPDLVRSNIILAVRKSAGPNIDAGAVIPSASTLFDKSFDQLKAAMAQATMAAASTSIGNSQYDESVGTPDPYDEATYGDLDTLFVGWDQFAASCYVSELLYVKIA